MKACIYARISLDRTGEELGVTRQLEDCRALAAKLDWPIVETYVDNDISASSGKARPEYLRML
jgi:site-specific DNA recombinase